MCHVVMCVKFRKCWFYACHFMDVTVNAAKAILCEKFLIFYDGHLKLDVSWIKMD